MNKLFDVPILLLVFRRPEITKKLFNEIRKIKPHKLFIGCDGPRENVLGEKEKVEAVKDIFKNIDWDCDVETLFFNENKGSKMAESMAMNWFFENVEEGIILEDDCIPGEDFFEYCKEMLEYYRHDKRIMLISGSNFQFGHIRGESSYYFSKFPATWGWATWKRAWKYYDVNISDLPEFKREKVILSVTLNKTAQKYFSNHLEDVYKGKIDAWDTQIFFMLWAYHGLAVVPNVNLISNIGIGEDSVNTEKGKTAINFIPIKNVEFPLKHPKLMIVDKRADEYICKVFKINLFNVYKNIFKKIIIDFLKMVGIYKYYRKVKGLSAR